jgi:hypothetical protein
VKTWMAAPLALVLSAGLAGSAAAADVANPDGSRAVADHAVPHHTAPNAAQVNRRARLAAQRKRALAHKPAPRVKSGVETARELDTIKAQNKMNERQRELDRAQQNAHNPDIGIAKRKFDDSQNRLERVQPLP